MGTRYDPRDGLLVMDPRLVDTTYLAANTGAALTSDYQEAGPRPGKPVAAQSGSRLAPVISQAQAVAARVQVTHSGLPGREDGCALAYRLESETDASYRGWNPPNWITAWRPLVHTATADYESFCAVTHPQTQQVLAVYYEDSGETFAYRRWDPTTWSWSSPGGTLDLASNGMAMLALPTGRILLFVVPKTWSSSDPTIFYTDDVGDTWATYADDALEWSNNGYLQSAAVYLDGNIALYSRSADTGVEIDHFASADLGHNWDTLSEGVTLVDTAEYAGPTACVVDGRILLGYIRTSDRVPVIRILTSCYQAVSDGTVVEMTSGVGADRDDITLVADPDGTVWCFLRDDFDNAIEVWVSYDAGDTWTECSVPLQVGNANDYLHNLKAVSTCGYTLLLCQWVASTAATDGSVGGLLLGGWSNVVAGASGAGGNGQHRLAIRTAFGLGQTWLPIELPSDFGWTLTGTAGTLVSPGEMNITTAAATGYYTSPSTGTDLAIIVSWDVTQVSGASYTTVQIGDGAEDYVVTVTHTPTALGLYDDNGAADIVAATAHDLTEPTQFLLYLVDETSSPNAYLWYRAHGSSTWTLAGSGDAAKNTTAPLANGSVIFGRQSPASSQESTWRHMCYATGNYARLTWDVDARLHGKPLTSAPVPVPDLGAGSGETVGCLSVRGGPGRWGEEWTIAPRYDYPIEALFSGLSPSPSIKWRSTDTSEQKIALDFTGTYSVSWPAMSLVILGANFRLAYLEYSTGGAWTTYATWDATGDSVGVGKESLTYALTGDVLRPASGGDDGERYLWGNELAGGTAVLDLNGTPEARRIAGNTPGTWVYSVSGATPVVRVRIEGLDGGEASTGDCFLLHPSGLTIESDPTPPAARYWRVRIPASQDTAEGYYEAGHIGIYRAQPFGAEVAWGSSESTAPNVATTRSRWGTTRTVELGPPATTWSLGFTDGEHHTDIRSGYLDLDHFAFEQSGTGPALVAVEDTAWLLRGILEETRSGEIPVVAVRAMAEAHAVLGATITDRTQFVYGRLTGAVGITEAGGERGVSEAIRTESISIEEIV